MLDQRYRIDEVRAGREGQDRRGGVEMRTWWNLMFAAEAAAGQSLVAWLPGDMNVNKLGFKWWNDARRIRVGTANGREAAAATTVQLRATFTAPLPPPV